MNKSFLSANWFAKRVFFAIHGVIQDVFRVVKGASKTKLVLNFLTAAVLASSPVANSAANNAYDTVIIKLVQRVILSRGHGFEQESVLSNNQIADWLQIVFMGGTR